MNYVIDACSIINTLLIDEDDILFNKLKLLNIRITKKVFDEIKKNLRKNVKGSFNTFDRKIVELIPFTNVYFDCGSLDEDSAIELYEEEIIRMTNYTKKNGEFYSTLCSAVVNRSKRSKVVFYTDDYKAREDFDKFYFRHQIGYIEDTADLIIFLFSSSSNYDKRLMLRLLSNLRSRYLTEHAELIKTLQKRSNDLTFKDKDEKKLVDSLVRKLEELNMNVVKDLVNKLDNRKSKDIIKLIEERYFLFEIDNIYIRKILEYEAYFTSEIIFTI